MGQDRVAMSSPRGFIDGHPIGNDMCRVVILAEMTRESRNLTFFYKGLTNSPDESYSLLSLSLSTTTTTYSLCFFRLLDSHRTLLSHFSAFCAYL